VKLESITARPKRVTSSPRRAKRIREECCAFVLTFTVVFTLMALAPAPAQKFTLLYTFDGAIPSAGLVMDASGNLYGTTSDGDAFDAGTVFKVTRAGKETLLHSFTPRTRDGSSPYAGLVMDAKGNLYGTTLRGGPSDAGTVFKVNSRRKETVLHSFTGGMDGGGPNGDLVLDAKGNV
jgi:uncharacterized repeat protein (TIGR03803 family)